MTRPSKPAPTQPVQPPPDALPFVGRRGAWATLVIGLVAALGLMGLLGGMSASPRSDAAPTTSESTQVAEIVSQFPNSGVSPVLVVAHRTDGGALSAADRAALDSLRTTLAPEATGGPDAVPPVSVSEDGQAGIIALPVTAGADNTENSATVNTLRDTVAAHHPSDLTVQVTGGIAFGADIAGAFSGANITLLLTTVGIVAILLLLTYRSPVLWLIPLTVVGLADQVASVVTKAFGHWFDLQFDAGVVSVLVFGAGTNYALLLVSRYRENLHHEPDHRRALAAAWRSTVPAIVASNITVVLSLLALALAVIPGTRGLGIAGAIGLVIAAVSVLTLLPAALAVCGRKVFWPFVPRADEVTSTGTMTEADIQASWWGRMARRVTARPVAVLAGTIALLAVMASGLFGTSVGLDQAQQFRVPSESAQGLQVLSQHFPAGDAQPMTVVAKADKATEVATAITGLPGVSAVREAGTVGTGPEAIAQLTVTGTAAPGSDAALDLVRDMRTTVHAIPDADALVGGAPAVQVDARDGNFRDLKVVAPIILGIAGIVLVVLLRSLLAPLLLLVVNASSAIAAIGLGSWLARRIFDAPALDLQVPLFAFLFLVALGIDYTIFLVHRARSEVDAHGTKDAVVRAVAGTGAVITSAGIVLAGVFAALAVLPLVTLGQLGLIVGLGVLVDTLVVRTLLVPALFTVVGDRIWWPHHPSADRSA